MTQEAEGAHQHCHHSSFISLTVSLHGERAEERADGSVAPFLREGEKLPSEIRDGCGQAGPSERQLPDEAIKAFVLPLLAALLFHVQLLQKSKRGMLP